MQSNEQLEDPIVRLLEKELRECITRFENAHGIIVAYAKLEMLRQETGDGPSYEVNLDARIGIIV